MSESPWFIEVRFLKASYWGNRDTVGIVDLNKVLTAFPLHEGKDSSLFFFGGTSVDIGLSYEKLRQLLRVEWKE